MYINNLIYSKRDMVCLKKVRETWSVIGLFNVINAYGMILKMIATIGEVAWFECYWFYLWMEILQVLWCKHKYGVFDS